MQIQRTVTVAELPPEYFAPFLSRFVVINSPVYLLSFYL